jgi:hypothetical protein
MCLILVVQERFKHQKTALKIAIFLKNGDFFAFYTKNTKNIQKILGKAKYLCYNYIN